MSLKLWHLRKRYIHLILHFGDASHFHSLPQLNYNIHSRCILYTKFAASAWVEDLLSGLTDLIRWYRTVTLSHEFRIGQRLDKGEVNDNLSAADYKKDTPGTAIDVGFPLQSAVVKRYGTKQMLYLLLVEIAL